MDPCVIIRLCEVRQIESSEFFNSQHRVTVELTPESVLGILFRQLKTLKMGHPEIPGTNLLPKLRLELYFYV